MPEFDEERLAVADRLRTALATENVLLRPQARAYVRCLQATWQVPEIQWSEQESVHQLGDARRLLHAAHIFRQIEGAASPRAIDCYRRTGEILEWLVRAADNIRSVLPIELLAAAAYQLGGLPAMASGLISQVVIEHEGVALYAAFLRADFDAVLRRAASFWSTHPDLTVEAAGHLLGTEAPENDALDQGGSRVAWFFTVELVRSLGLMADSLRRGDELRLARAMDKLRALDAMATRAFSEDAALVVSLTRQVAEGYAESTIYMQVRALSELNPAKSAKLLSYAREQYSRGRGVLWTSQIQGLQRLLTHSSFALCTPTGSGKTLVANLALVKELILRERDEGLSPLALYIVPSRALAGEVEAKLRSELGHEMIITGLYGGADWGITDYWLTGDQPSVVIATVEKADALMRYLGPLLSARLALLVVDEAHQVICEADETTRISFSEHSNRAIRLESLVSRILTSRPDVVRIALTAVAGGASRPVAKWIERRADAEAVGVRYRSTRQVVGILETAPGSQGRILLDIMNGRPLYIRGQDEPVYLPLRMPPMPLLPAVMRNSLNRFNCLSVLWTSLHLVDEGQRILISVTQEPEQTMRWFKEALLLPGWTAAPKIRQPGDDVRDRFDEARSACLDYCGAESFELFLLDRGIASSHGQMPQRLRRLMTEMIERRICPITVATATLTEGVNLPFDLIFLTSLKRRSWDPVTEQPIVVPLSTAEFRNLSGRAGRPGAGRGIEGMTLIALPTMISSTAPANIETQNNQRIALSTDYDGLRASYIAEENALDGVVSPLALLLNAIRDRTGRLLGVRPEDFLNWLEATHPTQISESAGEGRIDSRSRLADMLDELDGIVLTALEEVARIEAIPMSRVRAEAHLADLWRSTFTSVAAVQEAWLEQAFIRRGDGIVGMLYPDPDERRRLYQYGFTPVVGRRFEAIAPAIKALLAGAIDYGSTGAAGRLALFGSIGELLAGDRGFGFRGRATAGDQLLLGRWIDVMAWWLNVPVASGPDPEDLRAWQRFTADNFEFRLGVAVGAVVAQAWSDGVLGSFTVPSLADWRVTTGLPWFGFWARELLRWGTHDPFVAFALSQNLAHTREAAAVRRLEFSTWLTQQGGEATGEDLIDPQLFLRWQASLPRKIRPARADRPEPVELTGTDGRRGRYNVMAVTQGGITSWMDPAGFELAKSVDMLDELGPDAAGIDFELRMDGERPEVHRIFAPV